MELKRTLLLLLNLCCLLQQARPQTVCSVVSNSGCQTSATLTLTGVPCLTYTIFGDPLCGLLQSQLSQNLCLNNLVEVVPMPDPPINGSTFCSAFLIGCCTTPTAAPTASPSKSPTASPSKSPSRSPTFSPIKSPTNSPSSSPTTGVPTASPTMNPTRSPQVAVPAFFDVPENVYMVSGIGGGLAFLIAAALLVRVLRNRRQGAPSASSSAAEPKTLPELRGKKGATPSLKVKIEQEVESSIFDWEKHIDKTSGEVYFFNPKTNESRWDPPEIVTQTIKNISKKVEEKI